MLMHDLRYAIRLLVKSPGFAAAAILTLAIAIGANTAMFSILYGVVLDPLPYRDADRIVRVWETSTQDSREPASPPDFFDWQAQQSVFSSMAGMTSRALNLTDRDAPAERLSASAVSHSYFTVLDVNALAGRGFIGADDTERVAVISEALWARRFGRRSIDNLSITLDGESYRVIGVMPASASISRTSVDVWFPIAIAIAPYRDVRTARNIFVVARLKDGVSLEQAQGAMSVIAKRLDARRGANVERLHDATVHSVTNRLWILFAAVAAVLLIACINIAGLLLARADARSRELAIRASLGASRADLVRQLLIESSAFAVAGCAAGIAIAFWVTRLFVALAPALPRAANITLSMPVLGFAAGVSFLAVILFGVIPAIRISSIQPGSTLASSRGVVRATNTAGRGALVVAEVALAVVLVTGAALLLKSLQRLMDVDLGINRENVMTFSMKLPEAKYATEQSVAAFYDAAMARIAELPSARGVAFGEVHPLESGWTSGVQVADVKGESRIRVVTPTYFQTLGMAMLRGKAFTRHDRAPVIVISDKFAARFFRDQNPIGKKIIFFDTPRTVTGVVRSEKFGGPQQEDEPAIYVPLAQLAMSDVTMIVRGTGDASLTAMVRDTIRAMDSDIALFDVETIDTKLGKSVATPRFQAVLMSSFGAIALLLAAIGLYELIAYQVQLRTNEIGVRMALGASAAAVATLVLRRAANLAIAGVVLGLAGAFALRKFLAAFLFQISATDPAIYISVPLLLAVIVLIASYVPARRAMRVDPAVALRSE
jgi:putative ABC transport system permease protein